MRRLVVIGLLMVASGTDAAAQYYGRPYYAPPPPRRTLGYECATRIATAYGPRGLICPLARPRPIGRPCVCPPPGPGPFLNGRVVR